MVALLSSLNSRVSFVLNIRFIAFPWPPRGLRRRIGRCLKGLSFLLAVERRPVLNNLEIKGFMTQPEVSV